MAATTHASVPGPPEYPGDTRPPLMPHQADVREWMGWVRRGLLGDEMGLGKSRSAISTFDGGRVLIIAPAMVIAGGTWREELERWALNPDGFTVASYAMLVARDGNRLQVKRNKAGKAMSVTVRDEFLQDWDAVIVDEAHYVKNRTTNWTLATRQITKRADHLLLMTGTPMPNWAHELFTLLQLLRPRDARPGGPLGSHRRWIHQWFETFNPTDNFRPDNRNPHAESVAGLKACYPECAERPADDPCEHFERFTRDNLGDQFLRRLRDDVMGDLPPATTQTVETPLDTAGKRAYRELKNQWVTDVGETEVVAWSDGSRNVLLDKVTTSPWLLTKEGEPRGGKFEALRFDLEGRSRPTLVLAHYRDTVEASARVAQSVGARVAYVHGGVSKKEAGRRIEAFKRGELDVLVGSLETVAEGLTLTVADMAIFVERSFKPSRNAQAEKRIHRMGQTRPVTIRDYVTPGTVDARKRVLLASKTDQQMRVLSAAEYAKLL